MSLSCVLRALLLGCSLLACGPARPVPHSGFVDAPTSAVAAQVAGRVDAIYVKEGDEVRKGQVLAQLDSRAQTASVNQAQAAVDQANEALDEAQANLNALRPTVQGARADVAQEQATLDEAETNFQRTTRLLEGRAATAADVDTARAQMLEGRARLASLSAARVASERRVAASRATVADARAGVEASRAALQVAQVGLAEQQILAPFDGLVVQLNLHAGEWAAPGTPVVTVEDLSQLWVRLDIEETNLTRLEIGQAVEVRVIAIPQRTFHGHVMEIGAEGDFAVNRDVKRGRPDIRTFLVRVGFDERVPELRPGMTAEVTMPPRTPPPVASRSP